MLARRKPHWPKDFVSPASVWAPPAPRRAPVAGWLGELVQTIALALLVLALARMIVVNYRVDGRSMMPTLEHDQFLFVNQIAYASVDNELLQQLWPGDAARPDGRHYLFGPPRRGDIVVLWPPSGTGRPYIKRIIGLPGEVVEVRNGRAYVDGVALDEPYVRERSSRSEAPVRVPPDHYFVLGDNRDHSSDSRLFGPLPSDHIVGLAWVAYWPPERLDILETPSYQAALERVDGSR
jgi:signal peptidase I